jgi:hypothetical protein
MKLLSKTHLEIDLPSKFELLVERLELDKIVCCRTLRICGPDLGTSPPFPE